LTTDPTGRHSIRLPGYDYASSGAYFVTICAYRRELLFEDASLADVIMKCWEAISEHFPSVGIDAFVVMPNHATGSSGYGTTT
jgi:REP element-mobilizing transposase RayT